MIDLAAREGGYIMDASALIMDDAKVENVRAMIDFTLDYGTYSQSETPAPELERMKKVQRPAPKGIRAPQQKRPLGVCVPWSQMKVDLPPITGREELARGVWEKVDRLGYSFCWTNLTW